MECGISRANFTSHLIVKNFVQFSVAVTSYWLTGFAFSFGGTESEFIGENEFGGDKWLSHVSSPRCFSFGVLVGIFVIFIVNGSVAERIKYNASIIFSICLMIFIWPVVVAWTWGSGWLYVSMDAGILDLGGSIAVYTFAGGFALTGALIVGPREGRFSSIEGHVSYEMVHHELYIIGSMLTILGCFGIGFAQLNSTNYGYALANLWISGSVSSLVSLKLLTLLNPTLQRHYLAIYQGFIAGMVFISSAASNTTAWESGLHGLIAGAVFVLGVKIADWLKIDDNLYFAATFGLPGIFGGILPGFVDDRVGVYWGGWNSGQVLGTQVVGTAAVFLWSVFWGAIVFGIMRLLGILTIQRSLQIHGLSKTGITQNGYAPSVKIYVS